MCSGPYETGEWVPGESITLDRNDNYWNDDFGQLVGSITFVWPQDPAVIANAMNSGEIDGGWDIPPAALAALEDSDAGTLTIGTADTTFQSFSLIVANVDEGPLADVRLRQALSSALDREAIAEIIYAGSADALYSASPTGLWSYAEATFAAGYENIRGQADVAAAQALVGEIGEIERPVVMAIPAGDSVGVEMAAAVEQMATEAGIPFEILPMPPNNTAACSSTRPPAMASTSGSPSPTPTVETRSKHSTRSWDQPACSTSAATATTPPTTSSPKPRPKPMRPPGPS